MISELNKPLVTRIYGLLAKDNVTIRPTEETPLFSAVKANMPLFGALKDGEDAIDTLFVTASTDNQFHLNEHEESVSDVVGVVSNSIAELVELLCVNVIPTINAAVDGAENSVKNAKMNDYVVESVYLDPIHEHPLLVSLTEPYVNTPLKVVPMLRNMPDFDDVTIMDSLNLGGADINALLVNMVAKHADGWVAQVYRKYFGLTPLRLFTSGADVKMIDEWVLAYTLLLAAEDNGLADNFDGPLNEWRAIVAELKAELLTSLAVTMRTWSRLHAAGTVVLNWPLCSDIPHEDDNAVIYVLGANFNAFVKAGGSVEALVGAAITNRAYRSEVLLAEVKAYEQAYSAYRLRAQTFHNDRLGSMMRHALAVSLSAAVKDLPVDIAVSRDVKDYQEAILNHIGHYNDYDLIENLYATATAIVCKLFFKTTQADRMLALVNKHALERGCIPAEGAYYAAIDMVADFLVSQMDIG